MNQLCIRTTILAIILAGLVSPNTARSQPQHPLDALDATEIMRSVAILRSNRRVDDATPILSLTLEAPSKNEVLSWKPGNRISRMSRAVIRRDGCPATFAVAGCGIL